MKQGEDLQKKKVHEIDMCKGPLAGKMLMFALPLMLSGFLQLMFNAADTIIVGRFVSSSALAAVGSTSSMIALLTSLFLGLSVGTNILTARFYGASRQQEISKVVHTSIALGLFCGIMLAVIGMAGTRQLLLWMGTPDDILSIAVVYMRIYFVGMPVNMVYNLGAAVLRATGDTKRPLYFLMFAGSLNVILNLFLIVVLHAGVAGVALATVLSQASAAVLVVRVLCTDAGPCQLFLREIRIYKEPLKQILRIGLPASLQGIVFSFSNVLIQSSINSFGSVVVAGSAAAANIEGFVTTSMNAFHQTAMNFTSQNYGAGEYQRIKKVLFLSLVFNLAVGGFIGNAAYFLGSQLLSIYISDQQAVSYGHLRMMFTCIPYFLLGTMDIFVGVLRGVGCSMLPMVISLTGACGLRVIWIYTVFRQHHTLQTLLISYPFTWAVTALAQMICTIYIFQKMKKGK